MALTPTARMADTILGDAGPLETFVRTRRTEGKSWRAVAAELNETTGGSVDLSHEALRLWFPEDVAS